MPRITTVQHARKATRCQKCGKEIAVGDPYKHASPRAGPWARGRKLVHCHDCAFRPSELMTRKMAGVYAAIESYEDDMAGNHHDAQGFGEALTEAASAIREVAEEYMTGASNIEEGFGHSTSQSDEMQSNGDQLLEWCDQIEEKGNELERLAEELAEAVSNAASIMEECPV